MALFKWRTENEIKPCFPLRVAGLSGWTVGFLVSNLHRYINPTCRPLPPQRPLHRLPRLRPKLPRPMMSLLRVDWGLSRFVWTGLKCFVPLLVFAYELLGTTIKCVVLFSTQLSLFRKDTILDFILSSELHFHEFILTFIFPSPFSLTRRPLKKLPIFLVSFSGSPITQGSCPFTSRAVDVSGDDDGGLQRWGRGRVGGCGGVDVGRKSRSGQAAFGRKAGAQSPGRGRGNFYLVIGLKCIASSQKLIQHELWTPVRRRTALLREKCLKSFVATSVVYFKIIIRFC